MSVAPVGKRVVRIGPQHHGRRMPLARFARAEAREGHIYELEQAVVLVVDVPGLPHERVRRAVRRALEDYDLAHPGLIDLISDGSGSVIRAWELQSERHPDLTVYLSPPPTDDEHPWDEWIPDIVIEIISRSSRTRDYAVKPGDYLAAGVRQYWIIDPLTRSATIHIRRGDTWRKQKVGGREAIKTGLLPGFELKLGVVFAVLS